MGPGWHMAHVGPAYFMAGGAWRGMAGRGEAWLGQARQARTGEARIGEAGKGAAMTNTTHHYPHNRSLRKLLAAWRALAKDVTRLEQEIAKAKAKAA